MTIKKELSLILNKVKLPARHRKILLENFDFLSADQKLAFMDFIKKSGGKEILEFSILVQEKINALGEENRDGWREILIKELG